MLSQRLLASRECSLIWLDGHWKNNENKGSWMQRTESSLDADKTQVGARTRKPTPSTRIRGREPSHKCRGRGLRIGPEQDKLFAPVRGRLERVLKDTCCCILRTVVRERIVGINRRSLANHHGLFRILKRRHLSAKALGLGAEARCSSWRVRRFCRRPKQRGTPVRPIQAKTKESREISEPTVDRYLGRGIRCRGGGFESEPPRAAERLLYLTIAKTIGQQQSQAQDTHYFLCR